MSFDETATTVGNFVDYEDLERDLKKTRRQIQRWIKDGSFPEPSLYLGQTPKWRLEVIQAFLSTMEARQLLQLRSAEAFDEVICRLAASALSLRIGRDVDPTSLQVRVTQIVTHDEFVEAQLQAHAQNAKFLSEIPVDDAAMIAAMALPQLTSLLAAGAGPALKAALDDPEGPTATARQYFALFNWLDAEARKIEEGMRQPDPAPACLRFAEYDPIRALILCAWLFPSARQFLIDTLHEDHSALIADRGALTELATAALDDAKWATMKAKICTPANDRE